MRSMYTPEFSSHTKELKVELIEKTKTVSISSKRFFVYM
jgi:hypothetical protein